MTTTKGGRTLAYERLGYHVERSVFSAEEISAIRDTFTALHARGGVKGRYEPAPAEGDPLARYPRVMHPHRFMPEARRWLLDPRLLDLMEELIGEEVLAAQSMFYFKPPGARGQAWHQDNFYLNVSPGTCIAAWVAVDPSTEANGGLQVIPNTQELPVICPDTTADPAVSFTRELVPMREIVKNAGGSYGKDAEHLPHEVVAHKLELAPGDVLFFNGNVVHGSGPNASGDLWRRAFICHYMGVSGHEIAGHYFPLLNRQGEEVGRNAAHGGGPC